MTRKLSFTVPDMDCGACVRAITEAVHRLDAAALIEADLAAKIVNIGTDSHADFAKAIEAAGFTAAAA
jgi:copper chaperone